MWSDSQIVLHWVTVLSNFQPLCVTVLLRSELTFLMPTGGTAPQVQILQTFHLGEQPLNYSWLQSYGTMDQTGSIHHHRGHPSPLLVAAATATEFVPTTPSQPDIGIHRVVFINRHSTLNKLLTVIAYVLRFVRNLRTSSEQHQTGPFSAKELNLARLKWIKDTQQTVYRNEIANLTQIASQLTTSRITLVRQLRLFLDTKGYLRCGGRIHNAPLNEATKFPYLLPAKHSPSSLIVWDLHSTLCHSGTGATLTALRQSYWIPAG